MKHLNISVMLVMLALNSTGQNPEWISYTNSDIVLAMADAGDEI